MHQTASPARAGWRGLAAWPTRDAAVIVLPSPGPRAWTAPNANARSSDSPRTSGVSRQLTSAANEPPEATGAPPTVWGERSEESAVVPAPGRKDRLASPTFSGLDRSDTG